MPTKNKKSNADTTQTHNYTFTEDWFTNNIPRWEKYLPHFKDTRTKVLELGSFEGRSAIWLLENVLNHPSSSIVCVDNFKQDGKIISEVKERFVANTKPFSKKVKLYTMDTRDALKTPKLLKEKFDMVYIDASRHSKNVLEDAILSFPLLKEGGTIIFDDYTSSKKHDFTCPKKGIDAFVDIFSDELQVHNTSWQLIATKKPQKSPKPCRSELFARG